jgi:hypothetical protein
MNENVGNDEANRYLSSRFGPDTTPGIEERRAIPPSAAFLKGEFRRPEINAAGTPP